MTYDLLKLADECERFFNTNRSESANRAMRNAATAIREAHAEIERLRAELSTQETLVATLQEQKYAWDELLSENKFLLAELETANSLVKRYEAALDLIWSWAHICTFHVSRDTESGVVTFGIFNKVAQEFASRGCDTQLTAIEAAMKEQA